MGRNWQQLGEVPDSDDEALDSQESQESQASQASQASQGQHALLDNADIEGSADRPADAAVPQGSLLTILLSPRRQDQAAFARPATPSPVLSPVPQPPPQQPADSDDEIDLVNDGLWDAELGQKPEQEHDASAAAQLGETGSAQPQPSPPSQQSRQTHEPHTPRLARQLEQPHVFFSSPTSSLSSLSRSPSPIPDDLAPQPSDSRPPSLPSSFPVLPDSPPTFRFGFVRSLRPRKPIQQHPYLLESVQYAHAMKSHGVKPVRTEYGTAPRKPAVEEDSQEQEFQDEESQLPRQERRRDSAHSRHAGQPDDRLYDFPASPTRHGREASLAFSVSPRTPAPAHGPTPTSSRDRPPGTGDAALSDEDDFPNPETFRLQRRWRQDGRVAKRTSSPGSSSATKRARVGDTARPEATPPARWIPVRIDSSPDPLPLPRSAVRGRRSGNSPSPTPPTPLPPRRLRETLVISDDEGEGEDEENAGPAPAPPRGASEESQSDSEAVRKNGRRIKGVLPASWLRLDQQKAARTNAGRAPAALRRPGPHQDQTPRRGVALPRPSNGSALLPALSAIFDESDEDEGEDDDNHNSNKSNNGNDNDDDHDDNTGYAQNASRPSPAEAWLEDFAEESDGILGPQGVEVIDDEDIGSVMEADVIDRMEPGAKRTKQPTLGQPPPKRLKRRPPNPFLGAPAQKTRQPKITRMFDRQASASTTAERRRPHAGASRRGPRRRTHKPPPAPPLLSILDRVEPKAPDFIRVAARTAKAKPRLGKTSPSRKVINLGSRNDNVDALSVLHDWRAGKIKPRVPNPVRRPRLSRQQPPPPLQDVSPNLLRLPSGGSEDARVSSASPAVQTGALEKSQPEALPNPARQKPHAAPRRPATVKPSLPPRASTMRPAQLETAAVDRRGTAAFVAKKKALDEMYRRRRRAEATALPNARLEQFVDDQMSSYGAVDDEEREHVRLEPRLDQQPEPETPPATRPAPSAARAHEDRRSRFRKRYNPRPVDTTAPRFVHALDPIPVDMGPVSADPGLDAVDPETDKLRGLGPFGSQYSQHFDIFPLDEGVFFHQSTLLGSGRLSAALGRADPTDASPQPALQRQGRVSSFQLDERTLSWDVWSDVSSSEFGILMDWLADALFPTAPLSVPVTPKVHTLVNFLLDFIETRIASPTFPTDARQAFVLRSLEVVASFIDRFALGNPQRGAHAPEAASNSHLVALTGTLAVTAWLQQLCRESPECRAHSLHVEDLLTKVAKLLAATLLKHGLGDLRAAYGDLQRPLLRDRGIRRDMQSLGSWVALMQVLGHARIPRTGFWDVAYGAMLAGKALASCSDARQLEQLWEDVFTLLPLAEFDSAGRLQAGLRQVVPLDGWELPRKALDRVFQLYKANPHQSPSFNAYCRALVGRCHYLVQEWGWRHCKTIVGTIFDFYGSQDFAHLRNEEVYRSPRFLEALAASPSLSIDAEDKCFHIFIKMLGLVIQQLRRLGLTKEMANLIARILPNHDRQYLKEKDVHQRDLAALRNHHDLLCTLFWAAAPEARPSIHQIEKLVVPAHAHKEACLINIRAWNQLARFVVASDEDYGVYKGFGAWMKSIFTQVLEQYQSAESDMHRQFQSLSSSMMQGIGPSMLKAMAEANQAMAMDVLRACVVASLDVLRHARSLRVATYCLNTEQLDAIFSKIDLPSPKTDWSILDSALDVLEHYMDRLEKAVDEQYSSSADAADPDAAEEAVMVLDHRLAKSFFRLTNTITHMSWAHLAAPAAAARLACTERSVVLAARLASRFVHSGVYGLSRFFGTGDYCVFARLPHAPGLAQRRFLPLFVSALISSNVFDFKDLRTSILELWLLAIVKPEAFLAYETRLAAVLRQHDLPYLRHASLPTAAAAAAAAPSYQTNHGFFASAMASMRQQLRDADGGARRQQLRGDFAQALKLAMQQIKTDLRYTRAQAPAQPRAHDAYIGFTRGIVSLMRSHGSDICTLDAFFYEQSADYAPSPEDPQLRTASIVTYGLRLGEGETMAAPQLFHCLHNNFKIAFAHDSLGQECAILERSMENSHVLGFVLARMLPAILRALSETEAAWPLLDVYCSAVEQLATRSCAPKAMGSDSNGTEGVVGLLEDIAAWLPWTAGTLAREAAATATAAAAGGGGGGTRPMPLVCVQVNAMAQLAALANVLQPFLMACACLPCAPAVQARLDSAIAGFCRFADAVSADLGGGRSRRAGRGGRTSGGPDTPAARTLFATFLRGEGDERGGIPCTADAAPNRAPRFTGGRSGGADRAQVDLFSKTMVQQARDSWVVGDGCIRARTAVGSGPGPGPGRGVPLGPWTLEALLGELQRQLRLWTLRPASAYGMGRRTRRLFPGRLRGAAGRGGSR